LSSEAVKKLRFDPVFVAWFICIDGIVVDEAAQVGERINEVMEIRNIVCNTALSGILHLQSLLKQ